MAASPWDQAEVAPGTVRARVATALAGEEVNEHRLRSAVSVSDEVVLVAALALAGGQVEALMAARGGKPFGPDSLPAGRKVGSTRLDPSEGKEVVLLVALQAMLAWIAVQ